MKPARPFLRWVGGKRAILPAIAARVPATFRDYHEPFLGGGAVYWHLHAAGRIRRATLCDANERLVRTYRGVRDSVEVVIQILDDYAALHRSRGSELYASTRASPPDGAEDARLAAWFIYLNRTCFNGLWRENLRGQPNAPYGQIAEFEVGADNLRACSVALQCADIRIEDFGGCRRARSGDFVYFDPPYLPVSPTANFTAYTPGGFGVTEHVRVRDIAAGLKARRVHVLLSNASVPTVHDLYAGFDIHLTDAPRSINCKGSKRGTVGEVLIT